MLRLSRVRSWTVWVDPAARSVGALPGALDGEVAFLAEHVSKAALFQGGVTSMLEREPGRRAIALDAYIEGAVKAVRQLCCSAPSAGEILLSGRKAAEPQIVERLSRALADIGPVRLLRGSAAKAKQGAQGAALLADGLSGGTHAGLVERLSLRQARGTVLDHLVFISPETARRRLGMPWMPERRRAPHVLVAGVTTRALALSAVRAGYRVTAIDAFADLDLQAAAQQVLLARSRSPGEPYGPMEAANVGSNISARLPRIPPISRISPLPLPGLPGDGNSWEIHPRRCVEPGIRWSSCESFGAAGCPVLESRSRATRAVAPRSEPGCLNRGGLVAGMGWRPGSGESCADRHVSPAADNRGSWLDLVCCRRDQCQDLGLLPPVGWGSAIWCRAVSLLRKYPG